VILARVAALLVIASQLILLWLLFDFRGQTAIWFTFAGHPLVGLGVVLGLWALLRRKARERAAARTQSGAG
jgi:hypothetical protein